MSGGRGGRRSRRALLASGVLVASAVPTVGRAAPATPPATTAPGPSTTTVASTALPPTVAPPASTDPASTDPAPTTTVPPSTLPPTPPTTAPSEVPPPPSQPIDIEKRVDRAAARPGEPITYTLTFQCSTTPKCTSMEAVDVLPSELRFVGASGWPIDPPTDGRTVVFRIGDREPGFEGEARIVAEFPAGTPAGTEAVNQAELRAAGIEGVRSNPVTVRSLGRSEWNLVKRGAPGFTVGQLDTPYTYRVGLTLSAASTQAVDGVAFIDRLPARSTFVSATGGGRYDPAAHTVRWEVGTIEPAPGRDVTVSRDVTVLFPSSVFSVDERVTNEADATGTPRGDPPTTLDTTSVTMRLRPAGLVAEVQKRGTTSTLRPGQVDAYSIVAWNNADAPLTDVVVDDDLPAVLAVAEDGKPNLTGSVVPADVRWRSTGGAFRPIAVRRAGPGWEATLPAAADAVRVTYAVLDPGRRAPMTLRAGIPAGGADRDGAPIANGAPVENCATATSPGATVSRRSCSRQQVASVLVGFALDAAREAMPGTTVTWAMQLSVTADSPAGLRNPTFTSCLPVGLDVVDPADPASPANGSPPPGFPPPSVERTPDGCGAGRVRLTWSFAGHTVAPGGTGTLTVNTPIPASAAPGSTFTNLATLSSDDLREPTSDEATVRVPTGEALVVGSLEAKGDDGSGFAGSAIVSPGGRVTYRLRVTNQGAVPVTGLRIVDILPVVGDQRVVTGTPRGSQWTATFVGARAAGATVTVSPSRNPCRFRITIGCDDPGWVPVGSLPSSQVGAVQIEVGDALVPGASVTVELEVTAPADAARDTVGRNSFGFETRRADSGETLLPTEPSPVGAKIVIEEGPPGRPSLEVQKLVNGAPAPAPPGPFVNVGDTVLFTFVVTNDGDTELTDVRVLDDVLGEVPCPTTTLQPGESTVCAAPPQVAAPGLHRNVAVASALATGNRLVRALASPGHYTARRNQPAISVVKHVNGQPEREAPGPTVDPGAPVTFEFVVINDGRLRLDGVTVVDDKVTNLRCDRTLPARLLPDDSFRCWAVQPAVVGPHVNTVVATGRPADGGAPVTATDVGHYTNGPPLVPEELPTAGSGSTVLGGLGAALVALGGLLTVIGRRRTPHASRP